MSPDSADRERLEAAMASLCAERGYAAVDRAALLERAGVGEGGFERCFADLEDCFCSLVRSGTEELLLRAAAAFAARAGWQAQLRATAWEMLDFLREDPGRAWAMVVDSPSACARSREIRERGMAALAALIDLGRAEAPDSAAIPPAAAEIAAGAIYNNIHAAVQEARLDAHGEAMVRELMYTAVRPFLGTEAALTELDAPRPG